MNYITCKQLIDFIVDYVSGELPPAERHEFERHLAVCPPCVAYLSTYRETIRLGRDSMSDGADAPPKELVEAILASWRESRQAGS
jgi:anti-sigma factor RsiW